jgi:G patch domain-containing protein 1
LNDNGSDDEDPYQMGPQILYNRVIGANKKKRRNPKVRGWPSAQQTLFWKQTCLYLEEGCQCKGERRLPKVPMVACLLMASYCRGMDALGSMVSRDGKYSSPEIPKDWMSSKKPEVARDTSNYLSTAEAARAQNLDPAPSFAARRSAIARKVSLRLLDSVRASIASASGKTNLPVALAEAALKGFGITDEEKQKELWSLVPKTDRDVAIKALGRGIGGWMPYAEDEAKRARYRAFLEIRAGLRRITRTSCWHAQR